VATWHGRGGFPRSARRGIAKTGDRETARSVQSLSQRGLLMIHSIWSLISASSARDPGPHPFDVRYACGRSGIRRRKRRNGDAARCGRAGRAQGVPTATRSSTSYASRTTTSTESRCGRRRARRLRVGRQFRSSSKDSVCRGPARAGRRLTQPARSPRRGVADDLAAFDFRCLRCRQPRPSRRRPGRDPERSRPARRARASPGGSLPAATRRSLASGVRHRIAGGCTGVGERDRRSSAIARCAASPAAPLPELTAPSIGSR
jgi:hypothetical protein